MKRMVKNGDLLDVDSNGDLGIAGNTHVDGRLQVNSSIISNGEIRGGNISGTKFLLGTEEMPLVKANPTGEATETLEKVKIGDVAYKVGGASENDKELTLILPYPKTSNISSKYVTIADDNVWGKLLNYYYETIKIYYNDGYPLGVFHVLDYYAEDGSFKKAYSIVTRVRGSDSSVWYGKTTDYYYFIKLIFTTRDGVCEVGFTNGNYFKYYDLDKAKFDALYKLADKPTQDGNYVLKATVSGGAVTYTWAAQ